jgi:2-dehydro-3-deoxy-D-arabinonate dehydratase
MEVKLCRFTVLNSAPRVGLLSGPEALVDLTSLGVEDLGALLESDDLLRRLQECSNASPPRIPLDGVRLCAPIERQEVWAAGVTYLRSKAARMEESDFSATAYDRVYVAERPELFFKSLPEKVVAPDGAVGIRRDARWSVPEPELVLVVSSAGKIVGYSIGNDMSSRDIEGENLLYLPQAKIYEGSCAIGPWITVGVDEAEARAWGIKLTIQRDRKDVFFGETSVAQIKRSFSELAEFLFRCQVFPQGAALLTGTGIIPPDDFTLREGDVVEIAVSGIGVLRNRVRIV